MVKIILAKPHHVGIIIVYMLAKKTTGRDSKVFKVTYLKRIILFETFFPQWVSGD